jgi:hypothetical protein
MVVKVRVWGMALLALVVGASCNVYPDQEVHASLDAEQAAGSSDTYRVVHSAALSEEQKSAEGFPEVTREFAARAANPGLSSFTELERIAPSCVPELSKSDWAKIDRVEIVEWASDGAYIAYLMPEDGDSSQEIVWNIEEKCKVDSRPIGAGVSNKRR